MASLLAFLSSPEHRAKFSLISHFTEISGFLPPHSPPSRHFQVGLRMEQWVSSEGPSAGFCCSGIFSEIKKNHPVVYSSKSRDLILAFQLSRLQS